MARKVTKGDASASPLDTTTSATSAPSKGILLLGAGLALVLLVAAIGIIRMVFPSADTDASMLPNEYRESTGLGASGDVPLATPTMVQGDRARFPLPRSVEPIIVDTECPRDTVPIRTGRAPSDIVCIVGRYAGGYSPTPTAPILECTEHDVVVLVDADTLACVRFDR